jgi:predicted Fe-Mo cluster-binding NifX family protein
MKIAIPTRDGRRISSNIKNISGFKVFEIIDGKVIDESFIPKMDVNSNGTNSKDNSIPAPEPDENELSSISGIMDCDIIISNGLGKKMFEELVRAQKEVYITEAVDARRAINHFIRQTLHNHPEMV